MSRFRLVQHAAWFAVPVLILAAAAWFAGPVLRSRAAAGPTHLEPVTFTKHVAPILFKHCASCHRPGEIGPFPLLTFKDAAKRAKFLKEITAQRRMPPWKPVHGYGEFQDARRLSDEEIAILARWADTGAKQGEAKDLPPQPNFPQGWQLGKPDLVVKMPEPFTVPAGKGDVWRAFVLPTDLKEDQTVAAIEFRPGNRRIVHHAVFALDTTGEARKKDEADPGPGFRSSGAGIGIAPTGMLGAWVPGSVPRRLPVGVARRLAGGSDVVMQIHYKPSGKEEKDQSTLGIFFTDKPATRFLRPLRLAEHRLRIPAGQKRHRVAESYTVPVDVHVISLGPHMHLLGREMKVTATLPDGKKQTLIWINDWDFNWQGQYRFARPVALPKGTILEMEAFFDNSAGNPSNPNHPPKTVWTGGKTTDEMCECNLYVLVDGPRNDGILLLKDQARTRTRRKVALDKWMGQQEEIKNWRQWLLEREGWSAFATTDWKDR